VANACRTCGRWPSLFELEGSTIEAEPAMERDDVEVYEPDVVEPAYVEEPEIYDVGEASEPYVEVGDDGEVERPKPLWQRLASLIVPIGVVLYIIISALANRDGG